MPTTRSDERSDHPDRRRARRSTAGVLAALLIALAAGCSADHGPITSGPVGSGTATAGRDAVRGISALLDRRARAVRDADRAAYDAGLGGPPATRADQAQWFDNVVPAPARRPGLPPRRRQPGARGRRLLGDRRGHPPAARVRRDTGRHPRPLPVRADPGPVRGHVHDRPGVGAAQPAGPAAVGPRAGRGPRGRRRARRVRRRQRRPGGRGGDHGRGRDRLGRTPDPARVGPPGRGLRTVLAGVPPHRWTGCRAGTRWPSTGSPSR